jgi:hypothetical protein
MLTGAACDMASRRPVGAAELETWLESGANRLDFAVRFVNVLLLKLLAVLFPDIYEIKPRLSQQLS